VGYDIAKTVNGIARSPEELVALVKDKLTGIVGEENTKAYAGQFHFAIAVHSIECWLLPFWGKAHEADGITTCKQRVDNGLAREKLAGLHKDDVRTYAGASADFRKKARLLDAAKLQTSLGLFCHSLQTIGVNPPEGKTNL
jgi:hypothetical protein